MMEMESQSSTAAAATTVAKQQRVPAVWGSTGAQAPKKADSLKEVMSEQLASRLQEEQESLRVEQLLRDEALAASLQHQFDTSANDGAGCDSSALVASATTSDGAGGVADSGVTAAPAAAAASSETDSDLALAQQLQREFDRQYNQELQQSENKLNGNQKVRVTMASHRRPESPTQQQRNHEDADEQEDEDDDDDDWEDVATTPSRSGGGRGVVGGRCPDGSLRTKHDAEVTGRRNAARMSAGFGLALREGDTAGMDVRLSNRVFNGLKRHAEQTERRQARLRDKQERSTAEAALDEKTRTILFKQVSAGRLASLGGIVATGKESVVIHAYCPESAVTPGNKPMPPEVAIKVFKTTLNEFKSRSDYVTGDFRVCKDALAWQNPRKVMRVWCEKELLNLRALLKAGLPCPRPLLLRSHVLFMSFIGEAGTAAPRLKDCRLEPLQWRSAWDQAASHLDRLYNQCRLVHADFSEYNLLWWRGTVWIIDVSQAVERGHPKALEFLLRDCRNACAFFGRQGVADVPDSPERLFNRITGLDLAGTGEAFEERLSAYLDSRLDFERDRVHLDHGQERRHFQFDHFFVEGGEADNDEEEEEEEEEVEDEEDDDLSTDFERRADRKA